MATVFTLTLTHPLTFTLFLMMKLVYLALVTHSQSLLKHLEHSVWKMLSKVMELMLIDLVSQEDLVVHYTVRLVKGDKGGSMWLVVNDQYMYHKNDMSIDGHQVYWECARRKQTR